MARYGKSRTTPIILIIIIIVVAIAAIVSLARAVFFSDSSRQAITQIDSSRQALLSTTAGRKVGMTARGAIVADESFYSYRIEVTPASRSLVTYNGYLERQIDNVSLDNNVKAYDEFVNALDRADLAKGESFTGDKDDTRGICATGRLYEFEIIDNDSVIKRLWTSTCSGSTGSLNASVDQLSNLFIKQIPDSESLIRKLDLGTSTSLF